MIEDAATLRVDSRNELGEASLWCQASKTLYWADVIKPGRVFHWDTRTSRVDVWDFDEMVTGLNLIAGGGLLVHGKNRILRFSQTTGEVAPMFALPPAEISMRFNDGHCDREGRLWVGTMPNNIDDDGNPLNIADRNGQIYVINDTESKAFDAHLGCPNAICWSPDSSTFYVADSCDGWIYSYRFDRSAGMISDRRKFCYFDGLGTPDGAAVDEDGCIWNARWGAGVVVRISPDGSLDRTIHLPVSQPTSCCFGDEDRRTLYITSARFSLTPDRLRSEPLAGGVFSIRVEVAGIDVPPFLCPSITATDGKCP